MFLSWRPVNIHFPLWLNCGQKLSSNCRFWTLHVYEEDRLALRKQGTSEHREVSQHDRSVAWNSSSGSREIRQRTNRSSMFCWFQRKGSRSPFKVLPHEGRSTPVGTNYRLNSLEEYSRLSLKESEATTDRVVSPSMMSSSGNVHIWVRNLG